MTDPKDIAANYIATWNETDDNKRRELIEKYWSETPSYIDPLMTASNASELAGIIGAVQDRFPGFVFRLISLPDGHADYVRFAWGLGPDSRDTPVEGSDIIETRAGRIDRVVGFFDKMPAL